MKMSKLFGRTLREDPGEAELVSHRLLLQSGMINRVASGVYSYLPLAWRSIRKIEEIIRQEIDKAGGQEIKLGILQPRDLWKLSGRDDVYGPDMLRLKDRRDRDLVLPPTNEELITETVKNTIQSYRDLPILLYQIQTKFRDEPRPRGGLIRVREFDMMDAYSFDLDDDGLDKNYDIMVSAYKNIFRRCGIETIVVEADSGAIGGKDSKEFILITESGEDTIVLCNNCGYAANDEKAIFQKSIAPLNEVKEKSIEEVSTPDVKTIKEICEFLNISSDQTLKTIVYVADNKPVCAVIRGDFDINDVKLKNLLKARELRLATNAEVNEFGFTVGSATPIGIDNITVVVDESVRYGTNFVAGANKVDHHLMNINYPRDFRSHLESDIALAESGFQCSLCTGTLETRRGIEIGHVFKLGTTYSESMQAKYPDQKGKLSNFVMGCYGIGVGRILAGALEQGSDERGIIFPVSIAPYQVTILSLNTDKVEIQDLSEKLYADLHRAGIEVLYDDRDETAGVKLNDADLMGLPLRVVVSSRNLTNGEIEIKLRSEKKSRLVEIEKACETVTSLISDLKKTE